MSRIIFITGTDTDCGKTYVTSKLVSYFKNQGKNPLAIKPIASGYKISNNLHDACILAQANNKQELHAADINLWSFDEPIAPHIAAKKQEINLNLTKLGDFIYSQKFAHYDPLLVEGAGGLMVPLDNNLTWLDFLSLYKIPVILVIGMKLGCINHALLTQEALKSRNIICQGFIANQVDKNMLEFDENLFTLKKYIHMPFLGEVKYKSELR